MESRKRKREAEAPRIQYHVEQLGRSFERILKEDSREELRNVVRKKLGLDQNTQLDLVQVREGRLYDLEDDEDFETFKVAAHAYSSLDVRVSFPQRSFPESAPTGSVSRPSAAGTSDLGTSAPPLSPRKERRKTQKQRVSTADQSTQDGDLLPSPSVDGDRGADVGRSLPMPPAQEETSAPPKKKRKMNSDEHPNDGAEAAPPKKRRKSKVNESEDPMGDLVTPVEKEIFEEPPKKKRKRKKTKERTAETRKEQMHVSADPFLLAIEAGTSAISKPKKHKEKENAVDSASATILGSDGVTAVQDEPPKARGKKAKSAIGQHDHIDGGAASQGMPIPVGTVSASAPPPVASRKNASNSASTSHQPQTSADSSISSRLQSTLAAFLSRPARTPAEILASYTNADEDEGSEGDDERESERVIEDMVKPTKVKAKKRKAADKSEKGTTVKESILKPRKSRLRESWVPEEAADAPSLPPPPPQPSSSPGLIQGSNDNPSPVVLPVVPPPTTPLPARPHAPTKQTTSKSKSTSKSAKGKPSCPVCLSRPFHLRFQCPVIQSGVDAIETRIAKLREEGGKDDIIEELEGWVRKEQAKAKANAKAKTTERSPPASEPGRAASPAVPDLNPGLKTAFSCVAEPQRQDSPIPSWTPILPLESQPSEVTIESRDEGSSDESPSSSSGSGEDQPGSGSSSDADSDSQSNVDHTTSFGVHLEDVDLDALVRGPALALTALVDESDEEQARTQDDDDEGDMGVLEEEEEEDKPRRPKGRTAESSSPVGVGGDDDESDSSGWSDTKQATEGAHLGSHTVQSMATDTSASHTPINGREDNQGGAEGGANDDAETGDGEDRLERPSQIEPEPQPVPELHQICLHKPVPDSSTPQSTSREISDRGQEIVKPANLLDLALARNARSVSPVPPTEDNSRRDDPLRKDATSEAEHRSQLRTTPPPTRIAKLPSRPNTPHSRAAPSTPGTVQRMKDRYGNLPLNEPDGDTGFQQPPLSLPVLSDLPELMAPMPEFEEEEIVEKPKRGRSRAPSQPKSSVRQTRSRSRTAPPTSTPTDETSSASQPAFKRRGRPPLSEAVKAERKAIRDAERAAKAAENRAKAEEKKKATTARNSRMDTGEPEAEAVPSQQEIPPSSPQEVPPTSRAASRHFATTPMPTSQWKTLTAASSEASRSAPAVDQLMPSSQEKSAVPNPIGEAPRESNAFDGLDGIKSPGDVSISSTSRKHDEDDVEHIIGSTKVNENMPPPKRQPLFLPGASQMTQSQTVPRFFTHSVTEEAMQDPVVDEQEQSVSESSNHTESGSDQETSRKPVIPRPHLPSKSTFPSLSQLSFDKFRPSFLLPGRVLGQNKEKEQDAPQLDEESESEEDEDDESSDDEKQSHIPKGRRAGTGVVKRRKSRGLLRA